MLWCSPQQIPQLDKEKENQVQYSYIPITINNAKQTKLELISHPIATKKKDKLTKKETGGKLCIVSQDELISEQCKHAMWSKDRRNKIHLTS